MTEKRATIHVIPKTNGCPALEVAEADNYADVSVTVESRLQVPDSPYHTILTFKGEGLQNIECIPRSYFEVAIDTEATSSTEMGQVTVIDNGTKGKCAFMLKINGQWHDPQIYNTGGGG